MTRVQSLPVIVGFGGFNAAGRSSFHRAYQRLVLDSLPDSIADTVISDLAVAMGIANYDGDQLCQNDGGAISRAHLRGSLKEAVKQGTLIRGIDPQTYFDPDQTYWQKSADLSTADEAPAIFTMKQRDLPEPLPQGWSIVETLDNRQVRVAITRLEGIKVPSYRDFAVKAAGQLPDGFDPAAHYNARFHPRALQMAVVGASDALNSVGIAWDKIQNSVAPDEVGVYASNIMAQLDADGMGGVLQSRLTGGRVSTKNLILGLNSMTTDFINAYLIGGIGGSGSISGACASFLYNLEAGINELKSGRKRVVIVGTSEAPITSEIIDGYATMGALATADAQKKLYGVDSVDHRRSSRPFADNCGFTIAESAQFVVLMDDQLALDLGAKVHAAVPDVWLNADGYKKSISAPGPGNFITLAKAVASASAILGDDAVRNRSVLLAHGSSTPKNRTTESELIDRVAKAFDIHDWPVTAIKAFLGHSLASASGDQVAAALGMFEHKVIPGIRTADRIAEDVVQDRIKLSITDFSVDALDVAFINAKGFGGANGTAVLLSPERTLAMLSKRHGAAVMREYEGKLAQVVTNAEDYDRSASRGNLNVGYQFGDNIMDESAISIDQTEVKLPGYEQSVSLKFENPYADMTD